MPLVWIDVLTPKQAKIASILYQEFQKRGIYTIITTRRYKYIEETFRAFSTPYIVVGSYGESLVEKLRVYTQRLQVLLELLPEFDLALGFPSPEMHRLAFGLRKPIITLTDTAHSYYVNKLCLPLSTRVIVPEAIPIDELRKYIPEPELNKVRKFAGIFEVMWVKRSRPDPSVPRRLNLKLGEYVIFRPEEERAAYYTYETHVSKHVDIIRTLLDHNLQVVYMPRYAYQEEYVRQNLAKEIESGLIIVPKDMPLDLTHLEAFARLVITGGSTIALESSLMGIPSLCYFPRPFYIDEYVMKRGFPLVRVYSIDEVPKMLPKLLESYSFQPVGDLLSELEDPVEVITEEVLKLI